MTMPNSDIHVAIAGFNSRLARLITLHLLPHPRIHIHGLCRDASKVPEATRNHPRVSLFDLDAFDISSVRSGVRGCQTTICCYGSMAPILLEGQKVLIDASIAEGVARYIAGDFTWDFRRIPDGLVPPKNFTIEIAAYLEEVKDKIKGVHLLNGALFEAMVGLPGLFFHWDEKQQKGSFRTWGTGDEIWEITSYDDVARWTVEIVLNEKVDGYLVCIGDKMTTKDIAATCTSIYNKTFELELLGSVDDYKAKWESAKAKEPENVWAWLADMLGYHVVAGTGLMTTPPDNALFPNVKCTTLREWLTTKKPEELYQSLEALYRLD